MKSATEESDEVTVMEEMDPAPLANVSVLNGPSKAYAVLLEKL